MRRQRYLGKGQIAVCMRSGIKCHASELVRDGRTPSLLVLPEWADAAHPQERPYIPQDDEGKPPFQPSPDITPSTPPVLSAPLVGTTANLSWTAAVFDAGPRIEEYDVYRDAGAGFVLRTTVTLSYSVLGAILGPARTFSDTGLTHGVTYRYKVVALTTGPSLTSNVAIVAVP